MPKETFENTARDDSFAPFAPIESQKPEGTVLKYFHGPNRRFPIDYVVIEADVPDLPMSLDDLKARGFIS